MHLLALTELNALQNKVSCEFTIDDVSPPLNVFVILHQGQYFAYENNCPHTGVSLNWNPDVFLDMDNEYIQCSNHGALFAIKNGECLRGPCVGQYLSAFPLSVKNDVLYIDIRQSSLT